MLVVGETTIADPVPNKAPPQLPLYHFQLAPVPKLPPLTVRVVLLPEHIVDDVAAILVAAIEVSLTVISFEIQAVVLQVPSALTK